VPFFPQIKWYCFMSPIESAVCSLILISSLKTTLFSSCNNQRNFCAEFLHCINVSYFLPQLRLIHLHYRRRLLHLMQYFITCVLVIRRKSSLYIYKYHFVVKHHFSLPKTFDYKCIFYKSCL